MTSSTRQHVPSFDGTPISFVDSGTGSSTVLLLHGFLVDGMTNFGPADAILSMMERFAPPAPAGSTPLVERFPPAGRAGLIGALTAAGFRVIVPDMRGHGQSGKPITADGYRNRAMARDMIALLDRLGLDRVNVLGYSMGSTTTAHLIALAPERIRSAVLAGIGAYIVEGEPMSLPDEMPVPTDLPRPLTMPVFSRYAAAILDGTRPPEGFGAIYSTIADQMGVDPRVAAAVLREQLADSTETASLRAFTSPVLVLNGAQDAAAIATEDGFARYLPRVSFSRSLGDHLGAVLDPGFQLTVVGHFRKANAGE